MGIVTINQKLKRIEISGFEIDNNIVFEYFNKLPASQRDEAIFVYSHFIPV